MKLGYHDVKVISATAGTNKNAKRLVDFVLANDAGERINVQLYFATPENTRISMGQLRMLGWSRGNPQGLDAVLGAQARIEVYEDPWTDENGEERTTVKAKFVGSPTITTPMTQAAAAQWLDSMDNSQPASGNGQRQQRGW